MLVAGASRVTGPTATKLSFRRAPIRIRVAIAEAQVDVLRIRRTIVDGGCDLLTFRRSVETGNAFTCKQRQRVP